MAKDMKTGKYVADNGREYGIYVDGSRCASGTNSTKIGYEVSGIGEHPIPPGSRPRAVQVKSAAGLIRWVVCLTTAATLWTGDATTITMDPFAGSGITPVEFTATGLYRSEKIRGKQVDAGTPAS